VTLQHGTALTLRLETKPGSTGYDWHQVGETPACLTSSEPEYIPMSHGGRSMPGASSLKQIVYSATCAGSGEIEFEYRRSFEPPKESSPKVQVQVSITDNEGL
jgi:predicted secreted protein